MRTQNLIWTELVDINNIPKVVFLWLDDTQSLTAKLKQKFDDFSVNVLSQEQGNPYANEGDAIDFSGQCMIREVELLGGGQAVVFARSIIPVTKDTENLLKIGTKPLGEILFNDVNIQRGQLQITHANKIWGRRSTFIVGNTRVLVSEFFLKALYA